MMQEEKREEFIQKLASALRDIPFSFEFKVKKKPKGIRIIYEVTQEEMDIVGKAVEKLKVQRQ